MGNKVVLIAGVLLAAGAVAAMSSPSIRGQRNGSLLDDLLDGVGRTAERISRTIDREEADGAASRKGRRDRVHARPDDDADQEFRGHRGKRFGRDRDSRPVKDEQLGRQSEDDASAEEEAPSGARDRSGRRSAGQAAATEVQKDSRRRGLAVGGVEARTGQLFRALDRNGDGVIDTAEFAAALKRLDAGSDGKVMREAFNRFAKAPSTKPDIDMGDRGDDWEPGGPQAMRARNQSR